MLTTNAAELPAFPDKPQFAVPEHVKTGEAIRAIGKIDAADLSVMLTEILDKKRNIVAGTLCRKVMGLQTSTDFMGMKLVQFASAMCDFHTDITSIHIFDMRTKPETRYRNK